MAKIGEGDEVGVGKISSQLQGMPIFPLYFIQSVEPAQHTKKQICLINILLCTIQK